MSQKFSSAAVVIGALRVKTYFICILCTYNKHIKRKYNTMLVYKFDSEESQLTYVNLYPIYLPFFTTVCFFNIVDSQWIKV